MLQLQLQPIFGVLHLALFLMNFDTATSEDGLIYFFDPSMRPPTDIGPSIPTSGSAANGGFYEATEGPVIEAPDPDYQGGVTESLQTASPSVEPSKPPETSKPTATSKPEQVQEHKNPFQRASELLKNVVKKIFQTGKDVLHAGWDIGQSLPIIGKPLRRIEEIKNNHEANTD